MWVTEAILGAWPVRAVGRDAEIGTRVAAAADAAAGLRATAWSGLRSAAGAPAAARLIMLRSYPSQTGDGGAARGGQQW